jgi:hypothetical protein
MKIQAKWLRLIILLLIVNRAEAVKAQQSASNLDAYVVPAMKASEVRDYPWRS